MNHDVNFLRAVIALVFVVGLIWLLGAAIRKYGWRIGLPTPPQSKHRRLNLVEVLPIDPKNKLVIVRRDDTEHLLLVGQETTQVIETAIKEMTNDGTIRQIMEENKQLDSYKLPATPYQE